MMDVIKTRIPDTRDEWLANRMNGIGGSDAGAVLGFNQYKSPYTLWCEKTGRLSPDAPDSEAMRIGRDLEDYVARRWMEETGKKVRRSGFSFQSKEHPFMLANVDRLVVGENAGLECKTANALTRTRYDRGDIPASYYAQCMHYMAVTGLERWYIAVLVMGKGFYTYTVERDETEIEALISAEESFWSSVTNGVEPEIDGSQSTSDTLAALYPESGGETEDLPELDDAAVMLDDISSRMKELEKMKKQYENRIKDTMKDLEKCDTGSAVITWKSFQSGRLDTKKLRDEMPDIYEKYVKVSMSRRFTLKMKK